MRRCTFPLLVSAIVLGANGRALAAQATSRAADSLAIIAASSAFSRAYERGDAAAMLEIYTEDAVIFPDQSEALTGRDKLLQYWTLRPGNRVTHHRITSTSLSIEGAFAHDWGVYEVSGERDGKPWGPVSGKYVVVWRKGTDGAWRMQLDIWNRRSRDG